MHLTTARQILRQTEPQAGERHADLVRREMDTILAAYDLTKQAFAARLGLHRPNVADYLIGRKRLPSVAVRLAELGMSVCTHCGSVDCAGCAGRAA